MKGDFSRSTFNPYKHFSRVLMQQGRVQLDADWNEQVSILLHYLQTLATDIIGRHGGPNSDDLGFEIVRDETSGEITISRGRYYVDGLLCENDKEGGMLYNQQPGYPFSESTKFKNLSGTQLVYLDAWERHITYVEDEDLNGDEPSIREVALGKADTASRAQVVWQVKVLEVSEPGLVKFRNEFEQLQQVLPLATDLKQQLESVTLPLNDQTVAVLNGIIQKLSDITTDINEINASSPEEIPPALKTQLTAVKTSLSKLKALTISAVQGDIDSLTITLTEIETAMGNAATEIEHVRTRIEADKQKIEALLQQELTLSRAKLRARAQRDPDKTYDPCTIPPESRYRGAENQLYRVEVHKGETAGEATFKWSRENGSVIFPIVDFKPEFAKSTSGQNLVTDTALVTLRDLGRDDLRFGLKAGNWVEIVDDDYTLRRGTEALWQVDDIKPAEQQVLLKRTRNSGTSTVGQQPTKHPLLRRWDHQEGDPRQNGLTLDGEGTAKIVESTNDDNWLTLEDGIQIQFQRSDSPSEYCTGDYWLIPARTATGDVEWPGPANDPQPEPPNGVVHHYAPLAIISVVGATVEVEADCRRTF